jgi:tetratricopeptide (TPR) repeat protein
MVSVNIAVDIETHLGRDGRVYIIDTARLFPPEPPQGEKGSVFCRLLRRELLQTNPVPLSSDAFTNFGKHDSVKLNGDVRVAWTRMMTAAIPSCLIELEDLISSDFYAATDPSRKLVARIMHKHGINTRYLLHLRSLAKSHELRFALFAEAVSRAAKRDFFENLREIKSTDATQHAGLAVILLNQIFASTSASKQFWEHLPAKLIDCFPSEFSSSSDSSASSQFDAFSEIFAPWKQEGDVAMVSKCEQALLRWVLFQCGIELREDSLGSLRQKRNCGPKDDLFRISDVLEIKPKIKTISVGHILEKLRREANGGASSTAQQQENINFYRTQLNQREEALGPLHPIVAFSLENCGDLMVSIGDREAATSFFKRALEIRRQNFASGETDEITVADTLEKIALALHSFSMYDEATVLTKEAISIVERVYGADSTRAAALLHEEGSLLKGMGKYEQSAQQFKRAIQIFRKVENEPGSNSLASSLVEYARVQLHLGKDDEDIVQMQEQALQLSEKFWGSEHSRVATVLNNLSIVLIWHGDYERARPLCERSLRIRLAALGRSHAYSGHSASALGQLHLLAGNFDQAAVYLTESCEIYEMSKRAEPIAMGKSNYARLLMEQALAESDSLAQGTLLDEAQELLETAIKLATASAGRKDQDQVATFMVDAAAIHLFKNQQEKGMSLLEQAKTIRLGCLPSDHPNVKIVDRMLLSPLEPIRTSRRILVSQLTLYTSSRS